MIKIDGVAYMAHPFQDKLVVFIGTPLRCKRKEARDALIRVGGVTDDKVTSFTNYVVAFSGAEGTQAYKKAVKYSGLLVMLTEEQFIDILDGKAVPPEPPQPNSDIVVSPARDEEAREREREQFASEHLAHKRINSMARDGIQTSEGRVKVDMRLLEKMAHASKALKEKDTE